MSRLDEKTAMNKMGRAMTATMPPLLKLQIMFKMLLAGKDGEKRRKVMKEVKERRRFTVPRDQIEWYPTIDYQKCQSCQVCLDFCPKGVFAGDDGDKVIVAHPYECVMLCSGCEIKCPQSAISFPERKEFYKYVYYV